jgi:hypothetical protein
MVGEKTVEGVVKSWGLITFWEIHAWAAFLTGNDTSLVGLI